MPGQGRIPKAQLQSPDKQKRRDVITKRVAMDDQLRGPELPEGDWHPRTLAWWDTWRRSPQAQTFTTTDWEFLTDTALLHSMMWNGAERVAPELRLRVGKFGATPEDRLRLRVQIEDEAEQVAKAPAPKARKARLLNVVNAS